MDHEPNSLTKFGTKSPAHVDEVGLTWVRTWCLSGQYGANHEIEFCSHEYKRMASTFPYLKTKLGKLIGYCDLKSNSYHVI